MTAALLPAWRGVRRLLAVRLDNLGDVLMTTPALAAVRQALPHAHVTLLASPAGAALQPHLPDVDEVAVFEAPWVQSACTAEQAGPATAALAARLAAGRFDAAIVFTVCTQSALPMATVLLLAGIPLRLAHCRENPYHLLSDWVRDRDTPGDGLRHEVQRQLDLVAAVGMAPPSAGWRGRPAAALRFVPQPGDGERLAARLRRAGVDPGAPYFVVHPGASAASRRYPAARFAQAAQAVAEAGGGHAIVVGGAGEADLVEAARPAAAPSTALVGGLSLGELAALIGGARVTLCNNSGPAHVAAALGAPVVVLYALTNPQHTPWLAPARVLSHEVPCRHCLRSVCPMGHHACLLGVPAGEVAAAAVQLMGAHPAAARREAGRPACKESR
ncbi:glycosyltransferase family 9 protein [Aquincola sp. MAHUQ-54]|uniref:Glycosyltransferase family 9 protein n=1 Tax=Aquincola agrisoli TaxID=3119538 RepID=A0AAW9Q6X1_9BURK